jgi:hypothetical protein
VELQGAELADAIRSMGERWKPEWSTQTIGRLEWRDAPEEAPTKKNADPVGEARLLIMTHLGIQSDWLPLASLKEFCRKQDLSERAIDTARKELVADEAVVETFPVGNRSLGKFLASAERVDGFGYPGGWPATGDVDGMAF